ncbi:hypothetical protein MSIM_14970 [Mycobacterium simiae]|nr:hypothetical protein MSIM_14970 [Mycobacterium simiae]
MVTVVPSAAVAPAVSCTGQPQPDREYSATVVMYAATKRTTAARTENLTDRPVALPFDKVASALTVSEIRSRTKIVKMGWLVRVFCYLSPTGASGAPTVTGCNRRCRHQQEM